MTTIVAVRDGARTWIGSDTQITHGRMRQSCGPKWIRFGSWAVGISGDLRTINLCREYAERMLRDLSGPFEFTQRLHDLAKEFDYDLKPATDSVPPNTAQDVILANPEAAWSVNGDLSIIEIDRWWADGSGRAFALGALTALERFKHIGAEDMARIAIETAMHHDIYSGGSIWTEVLE